MSGSDLVFQQRQHLGNLLVARRFFSYCVTELGVVPATDSFAAEFERATAGGRG